MSRPVEIHDPRTWPPPLRDWTGVWAERLAGSASHASDLEIPEDAEQSVLPLLSGHRLRGYHFTRLLDHEAEWILEEGLRPLTSGLVHRRIDAALARGFISAAGKEELLRTNVFATGRIGGRLDRVCVILNRRCVSDHVGGVARLLSRWGGEGVYMGAHVADEALRELGRPAVVVVDIPVVPQLRVHTAPTLARLLVGIVSGCDTGLGDLHVFGNGIRARDVVAIWRPGEPSYNRLGRLPK